MSIAGLPPISANGYGGMRLWQLVPGLPLATDLAASLVPVHTCAVITPAVQQHLDMLSGSLRVVPERQRSLRAMFSDSWDLLQPIEREALMGLALFRGGAASDAAARVAPATPEALSALIDQSLLRRSETGRYEMHELVRQYAAEQLAKDAAARAAAQQRFIAYFAAWAHDRAPELNDRRQRSTLAMIEPDVENLRAAWEWAIVMGDEAAIDRLMSSLFRFFRLRSWFAQGDQLIALVIDWLRARSMTDSVCSLLGRALMWRGVFAYSLSRLSEAHDVLVESCELLNSDSNRSERALTWGHLCYVSTQLGEYERAEQYGRESLELFHGSRRLRARPAVLSTQPRSAR